MGWGEGGGAGATSDSAGGGATGGGESRADPFREVALVLDVEDDARALVEALVEDAVCVDILDAARLLVRLAEVNGLEGLELEFLVKGSHPRRHALREVVAEGWLRVRLEGEPVLVEE